MELEPSPSTPPPPPSGLPQGKIFSQIGKVCKQACQAILFYLHRVHRVCNFTNDIVSVNIFLVHSQSTCLELAFGTIAL